jgi:hypothetical protein
MNNEQGIERNSIMKNILCFFSYCILNLNLLLGQCPEYNPTPTQLSGIRLKCTISYEMSSEIYKYDYSLSNGQNSNGCIEVLRINLSYNEGSKELSDTGLTNYPRYIDKSVFKLHPDLRMIPVGIPILPSTKGFTSSWSAGFGINKMIDWVRAANKFGIEPGETQSGFVMTSYGLPGIRSFIVEPGYNPIHQKIITPAIEDSLRKHESTEEESEAYQKFLDSLNVKGLTIGPTAPPKNFIATIWCDTLLSYTRQSVQLDWLLDKNAEKRIDHKLEMAKRLLEKAKDCKSGPKPDTLLDEASRSTENEESILKSEYGDEIVGQTRQGIKEKKDLDEFKQYKNEISKSSKKRKLNESQCIDLCEKVYTRLAIKTLESLVREVEILNRMSERGKKQYITSEAYALLKYNTEYLLDQLSEKSKK